MQWASDTREQAVPSQTRPYAQFGYKGGIAHCEGPRSLFNAEWHLRSLCNSRCAQAVQINSNKIDQPHIIAAFTQDEIYAVEGGSDGDEVPCQYLKL